ncbi:DUF4183 domain-containing protein [Metabacillus bambusae]|uniref:DUF4183 domain-containing protein n=1 Tax=Metabacillus bambusae TaxID=2795218 RepID=A0ABS3MZC1_9BACI|nr:DUF4183 domain-containing protein [Metabacillus bambusae]MBO1511353.1 DUF4183 domain-containing protein [Metabacillus bambusae]
MKNKETNLLTPRPLINIPTLPSIIVHNRSPKKVKVFEFYAISNGCSRIYKENDGVKEIGKQIILDPKKLSYMNLFINGVLQPKESYEVGRGVIKLKTVDVPIKGAPVILQMFIV